MKTHLLLLVAISLATTLAAQEEMPQSSRDQMNYGTFKPGPYSLFWGQDNYRGEVQGDIYVDTVWRTAAVWFYPAVVRRYDANASDSIAGYQVRLDLLNHFVEFYLEEKASVVDAGAIRRVEYVDPAFGPTAFVNTLQYRADQEKLPGFFRLIAEGGELEVVQYNRLQVKKPTYNVALDVGNKNLKVYKKQEYYYRLGGEKSLQKFNPSSTFFKKLGGKKGQQTYNFIKEQGLNPKSPVELKRIAAYYNAL